MKVALIQQKYTTKTVDKIKKASLNKAELIVLQELHQTQYFCQNVSTDFLAYANSFKEDCNYWQNISKELNIVLITSLFEKRTEGLYHNTAVVFDKGKIAGKYRKMHIPDDPGFYEKFYFTQGDLGFEPIKTSIGKLGVLICWDQWFPESARIMALKGAEILIYPTAIGWSLEDSKEEKERQLDSWITIQRSHSIANGLPLISCNRVGFEKDSSGVLDGIEFWGNSFICGSQGEFLAKSSTDEEILYANIDKNRVKEVRDIWPFFRDRRVDAYQSLLKRFDD